METAWWVICEMYETAEHTVELSWETYRQTTSQSTIYRTKVSLVDDHFL